MSQERVQYKLILLFRYSFSDQQIPTFLTPLKHKVLMSILHLLFNADSLNLVSLTLDIAARDRQPFMCLRHTSESA